MFVELMPLLADRTVMITVARVDDQVLRVNVMATKSESENPALSTPLSCTGAPAELDAELGKLLANYVECHQQLARLFPRLRSEKVAPCGGSIERVESTSTSLLMFSISVGEKERRYGGPIGRAVQGPSSRLL